MIRRIMQVEVIPDPEAPELCRVVVRDPRTGVALAFLSNERTELWVAD